MEERLEGTEAEVLDGIVNDKGQDRLKVEEDIDLSRFIHRDGFMDVPNLESELITVEVRPPNGQSWIWIPGDPEWRRERVLILEIKAVQREFYLIADSISNLVDTGVGERILVAYQDRAKGYFLWPIRLTNARGDRDSWSLSAQQIITSYTDRWIRVKPSTTSYNAYTLPPDADNPVPVWPAGGFKVLLNKAFKGRVLTSANDPVIRRLLGYL